MTLTTVAWEPAFPTLSKQSERARQDLLPWWAVTPLWVPLTGTWPLIPTARRCSNTKSCGTHEVTTVGWVNIYQYFRGKALWRRSTPKCKWLPPWDLHACRVEGVALSLWRASSWDYDNRHCQARCLPGYLDLWLTDVLQVLLVISGSVDHFSTRWYYSLFLFLQTQSTWTPPIIRYTDVSLSQHGATYRPHPEPCTSLTGTETPTPCSVIKTRILCCTGVHWHFI